MKKTICILLILLLTLPLLSSGCANNAAVDDGRLTVVTTLFPLYDFTRAIAGDKADITLLLPPGVESHSFEPTPQDMVTIAKADLFIYTGQYMEPWALDLSEGAARTVDTSAGIELDEEEHSEEEEEEAHGEHGHGGYDPHIWTDPTMAILMVQKILGALSEADPDNADFYAANAAAYIQQLTELDAAIAEAVSHFTHRTVCFGGRFALHYFAKHYGLEHIAAFDSCSEETEPSARAVKDIIDAIRTQGIRAVNYEELTEPKVARSIAEETGAELLLLHSCHNVSKEELAGGATYLTLMYQNLENLKKGLA